MMMSRLRSGRRVILIVGRMIKLVLLILYLVARIFRRLRWRRICPRLVRRNLQWIIVLVRCVMILSIIVLQSGRCGGSIRRFSVVMLNIVIVILGCRRRCIRVRWRFRRWSRVLSLWFIWWRSSRRRLLRLKRRSVCLCLLRRRLLLLCCVILCFVSLLLLLLWFLRVLFLGWFVRIRGHRLGKTRFDFLKVACRGGDVSSTSPSVMSTSDFIGMTVYTKDCAPTSSPVHNSSSTCLSSCPVFYTSSVPVVSISLSTLVMT